MAKQKPDPHDAASADPPPSPSNPSIPVPPTAAASPAEPKPAKADAQRVAAHSQVCGAQVILHRLRGSGTGTEKLVRAEEHLTQMRRALGVEGAPPADLDPASMRAGAEELITAMEKGQHWPPVTIAKAREALDTIGVK